MTKTTEDRLGFLITNLGGGGAERVVSNLSRGLCEHRRDLLLFEDEVVYPFDGDVHILDVDLNGATTAYNRAWQMTRGLARLKRMKRTQQLETCISFLTWPNLFNVLSRRDERVVLSVRNNPSHSIRGNLAPVLKGLIRLIYPMADHIVAISENVRRDLIDNFGVDGSRITTIYNPIELDKVHANATAPLPPQLADLEHFPTIISMGRLAQQKGQWHLLRAFSQIKKNVPRSRLLLVGIGPYKDYLIELARAQNLSVWVRSENASSSPLDHDVIFWGFEDNPFPLLAASDIFAFPSLWEGLGNVLIESLACGLPIASADCRSGPREILAPNTSPQKCANQPEWTDFGVLLPVCDGKRYDHTSPLTYEEELWTRTLTKLLEDSDQRRRYARLGCERAKDFALANITAQWRSLLQVPALTRNVI